MNWHHLDTLDYIDSNKTPKNHYQRSYMENTKIILSCCFILCINQVIYSSQAYTGAGADMAANAGMTLYNKIEECIVSSWKTFPILSFVAKFTIPIFAVTAPLAIPLYLADYWYLSHRIKTASLALIKEQLRYEKIKGNSTIALTATAISYTGYYLYRDIQAHKQKQNLLTVKQSLLTKLQAHENEQPNLFGLPRACKQDAYKLLAFNKGAKELATIINVYRSQKIATSRPSYQFD